MGAGARQRGRARLDRVVAGSTTIRPRWREHIRALPQKVPLGRLGTESEISAAIVFLLSPAAAFISGSCIRIDGAVPNAKRELADAGRRRGGTTRSRSTAFIWRAKPKVLGVSAYARHRIARSM